MRFLLACLLLLALSGCRLSLLPKPSRPSVPCTTQVRRQADVGTRH